MNGKTKLGTIVRQGNQEYVSSYEGLLYVVAIFAVIAVSFLIAQYIISYSIQMDMLKNKLWSIKTEELLLTQKLHNINVQINKLYFEHSSVVYIGDKAFSIFDINK